MNYTDALKEILKENVKEIGTLSENELVIRFDKNEFFVSEEKSGLIRFAGYLDDYESSFEGQKKFVKHLAFAVLNPRWLTFLEDIDWSTYQDHEKPIYVDNKEYYFDILGGGDIYRNNFVAIGDIDGFEVLQDDDVALIEANLDEEKIRIVLESSRYVDEGFWVDGAISEEPIDIAYLNPEDIEQLDNKDELYKYYGIDYERMTLYFSNASEIEINKAIEFLQRNF